MVCIFKYSVTTTVLSLFTLILLLLSPVSYADIEPDPVSPYSAYNFPPPRKVPTEPLRQPDPITAHEFAYVLGDRYTMRRPRRMKWSPALNPKLPEHLDIVKAAIKEQAIRIQSLAKFFTPQGKKEYLAQWDTAGSNQVSIGDPEQRERYYQMDSSYYEKELSQTRQYIKGLKQLASFLQTKLSESTSKTPKGKPSVARPVNFNVHKAEKSDFRSITLAYVFKHPVQAAHRFERLIRKTVRKITTRGFLRSQPQKLNDYV